MATAIPFGSQQSPIFACHWKSPFGYYLPQLDFTWTSCKMSLLASIYDKMYGGIEFALNSTSCTCKICIIIHGILKNLDYQDWNWLYHPRSRPSWNHYWCCLSWSGTGISQQQISFHPYIYRHCIVHVEVKDIIRWWRPWWRPCQCQCHTSTCTH